MSLSTPGRNTTTPLNASFRGTSQKAMPASAPNAAPQRRPSGTPLSDSPAPSSPSTSPGSSARTVEKLSICVPTGSLTTCLSQGPYGSIFTQVLLLLHTTLLRSALIQRPAHPSYRMSCTRSSPASQRICPKRSVSMSSTARPAPTTRIPNTTIRKHTIVS